MSGVGRGGRCKQIGWVAAGEDLEEGVEHGEIVDDNSDEGFTN